MVVFVLLPGLAKSPKKLMGKSPIFNGKIHYFDWAIWKMSLFVCWNQRITKWSNDNWMMTASCDWVETSKSLWVHSRGKLYPRLYPQVMAEDHMISLVVVEPPTPLKNDVEWKSIMEFTCSPRCGKIWKNHQIPWFQSPPTSDCWFEIIPINYQ